MTNKNLNELAGKGKLPEIHKKAIKDANDELSKIGRKTGSTAALKSANNKSRQAQALVKANSDDYRGRKYWLDRAKSHGDDKRAWKVRNYPIKEALINMADKNLDEMKQNFETVLAEMASEALEQRRIEIAREFVA